MLQDRTWLICVAAFGALVMCTLVGAPTAAAASNPCGSTGVFDGIGSCKYATVGQDTFTVPPYETHAHFSVYGAGYDENGLTGTGGHVSGTLAVFTGEVFDIRAGGLPTGSTNALMDGVCDKGGYNGGGSSGDLIFSCGGAGASDVRPQGGGLSDRLFVAGGGGGSIHNAFAGVVEGGGVGGGESGGDGQAGSCQTCGRGAGGGTQSGAGASPGNAGSAGFGFGGSGGPGIPEVVKGGAGGGGGWYGGGGTGTSSNPGAGGGGSGYVTPLATDATNHSGGLDGVTTGEGEVDITWSTTPITGTVTLTSDHPSPVAGGTIVKLTTKVTTSTGAPAQGTVLLTDYTNGNGAANPTAPSGCPCFTIGQDDLDADGTFTKTVNIDSLAGGPHHDIVASYQDAYGVIPDTSANMELDRAPSPQTISFTSTAPTDAKAFGDTYTVSATATSGLPVSYSIWSGSASICTISGTTVSFIAPGTCVIQADQAGNAFYSAADTVNQEVTVGAGKAQTITFTSTPPTLPQPGSTYNVTATSTSGNPVVFSTEAGSSCLVTATGLVTFGGGKCIILADAAAGNGYAAAPQAEQDVIAALKVSHIVFLTTPPTSPQVGDTYSISAGASSGGNVTLTLDATSAGCTLTNIKLHQGDGFETTGTVTFTGAGTCVIDANGDETSIYSAPPQAQQTATVTAIAQTIQFTSTAPTPVVGDPSYTPTATGGDSGNAVTFSVDDSTTNSACSLADDGSFSFDHAGTCVIAADQAGNGIYAAADTVTQTITVGKAAQTISFTSTAPAHAAIGSAYTPAARAGSGLPVSFGASGENCSYDSGTGKVTMLHAGTCTITADQSGNDDYEAAPQNTQSITVDKTPQAIAFTSTPPSPALLGRTYTPTANGGGSGNPVVLSIDGASSTGACFLSGGKVYLSGPGACVIDADQAGAADYSAAPQKQQSLQVGFSTTLSGKVKGNLTVLAGQSVYLTAGTSIGGSVSVQSGGALYGQETKIGGPFSSSGATMLRLCGTSVGGTTTITGTSGLVVAGDDIGPVACAGNVLSGFTSITGNTGGIVFRGNTVRDSLTITGNTGTLPSPYAGTVSVAGNRVSGSVNVQH